MPKGGKKKPSVSFTSNLQVNDVESSSLSQSLTSPLLSDLLTPAPEIFDHEVTNVDVNDVAYTLSTSSSVAQDSQLLSSLHGDAFADQYSGAAPKGKAFIPRSILVPPAEIGQLEQEFKTGALEEDSSSPTSGSSAEASMQVPARGVEAATTVDMSYAPIDSTTIYPSDQSIRGRSHTMESAALPVAGHSLNSQEAPLLASTHPSYETNTSSSHRDWLLNPYRALLRKGHKLGEMRATAICGNDAVGSVLYMTGQCVAQGGMFAPIAVLIVNVVLYMFRAVYGEAVTALPLNGGAYNVLLNTTRKSTAAIAAVLTLLSYCATGVVSATEAIHYLKHAVDFDHQWITYAVIGLLFFFAVLNVIGIGESASVALVIFTLHVLTLCALVVCSVYHLCTHGFDQLHANWEHQHLIQPSYIKAVLFGYGAALLGVSGFETSSNFIEEQKPGVFVKTLRNMWALCSVFNTLIVSATVCIVDIGAVLSSGAEATIVAALAHKVGGRVMEMWLSIDAFMVLAGGVLTAYVGITGLVRRLSMDRCLPQFLLAQNSCRQTNHYIIFGFFALCASMYLMLNGNVASLSQTYSVSFVTVMSLFALGVMLLKVKRSTLAAEVTTTWTSAFVGFVAVLVGLAAGIARDHTVVYVFFLYFTVAWSFIQVMFFRYQVLKLFSYFAKLLPCYTCRSPDGTVNMCLERMKQDIQDIPMGFFTKNGDISVINKAILYVRENEDCSWLRIIHCFEDEDKIPPTLYRDIHMLNAMYPKLKIDLVLVKGTFSAALVAYISVKLHIHRNLLFITTPQPGFTHKLEDLGGVRLITH